MCRFHALLVLFTVFATGYALPLLLHKRGDDLTQAEWDALAKQHLHPQSSSPQRRLPPNQHHMGHPPSSPQRASTPTEAQWAVLAEAHPVYSQSSTPIPRTPSLNQHSIGKPPSPQRAGTPTEAQWAVLAEKNPFFQPWSSPPPQMRHGADASTPTTSNRGPRTPSPPPNQDYIEQSPQEHEENLKVWVALAKKYKRRRTFFIDSERRSRSRSPQRSQSPAASRSGRRSRSPIQQLQNPVGQLDTTSGHSLKLLGTRLLQRPQFNFKVEDIRLLMTDRARLSLPIVVPGKTTNRESWNKLWELSERCISGRHDRLTSDLSVSEVLDKADKAVMSKKRALLVAQLLGQQLLEARSLLDDVDGWTSMKNVVERVINICERYRKSLEQLVRTRGEVKRLRDQVTLDMKTNLIAKIKHSSGKNLKGLDLGGISRQVLEQAIVL